MMRAVLPIIFFLFIFTPTAIGHEVRPAYLNLSQTSASEFDVVWKQPTLNGRRLKLDPHYPDNCREEKISTTLIQGVLLQKSTLFCDLLEGEITINGLERTLTDVFVEITYKDAREIHTLLKPSSPTYIIGTKIHAGFIEYIKIGIDHILYGWDHIFFIIGLTLLISLRRIWAVATSFTIAHSLTLALLAFDKVSIPIRPVEILIALSIMLLGIEILRHQKGHQGMITRHPYMISFIIGLLHGCGFATAFNALDLSQKTSLSAIIPFNLGIEIGQFAVITIVSFGLFIIARKSTLIAEKIRLLMVYSISSIAFFWVVERTAFYIT